MRYTAILFALLAAAWWKWRQPRVENKVSEHWLNENVYNDGKNVLQQREH